MSAIEVFESYTISPKQEGQRLDVALASFMPERSLREVRRLWEQCLVEVNGRHSRKGMSVEAGDVVTISALPGVVGSEAGQAVYAADGECAVPLEKGAKPDLSLVQILKRENGILAIFKPSGLHSAILPGGRGGLSLEGLLPELCAAGQINTGNLQLFNRLDCLTTGMVLACENDESMRACEQAELSGKMEKRYLAIVEGGLQSELVIKKALDTDSRVKTKVLQKDAGDRLRHTLVTPLLLAAKGSDFGPEFEACSFGLTLVQATIYRGARHQIRAHLAHAGHPIWGDPVYNPACASSLNMYLHNFAVGMPEFTCLAQPVWPEALMKILEGLFPGIFEMHFKK